MSRMYRVEAIGSGAISNLTEDEWQTIKGRGWAARYKVIEATVDKAVSRSFTPPDAVQEKVVELKPKQKKPKDANS